MKHPILLWDLPTRLAHWLLVALVASAIVSVKIGGNAMDCHGRIGLAILGVVAAILSLIAGALTFETGVGPVIGIIAAALSLVTAMLGVVVSGIAAVQLFMNSTQGTSNKLDALQIDMLEWRKPSFAQIK